MFVRRLIASCVADEKLFQYYRNTHPDYAVKVENAAVLPSPFLYLFPEHLAAISVLELRHQLLVLEEAIAQKSPSRRRVQRIFSVGMEAWSRKNVR